MLENLESWFKNHPMIRKFVKGFLLFTLAFLVTNQADIFNLLPTWCVVPLGAILTAVAEYVRTNATLPIVGTKMEPSTKRKK